MSDRALDCLVAEKVMGWPPKPTSATLWWYKSHQCGASGYNPMLGDTCPQCHGVSPDVAKAIEADALYDNLPHYSTSIADAWLVIEQMEHDFWDWMVEHNGIHNPTAAFRSIDDRDKLIFRADADSVPRAICLAALKAVGVEVTA